MASKDAWLAMRHEYVTGDVTLQQLADKYGLQGPTVRTRAAAEHWSEQKKKHQNTVSTLALQKQAEKASSEIAEVEMQISSIKAKARLNIWTEIAKRIEEPADEMDGADFRRMVQNYCDMSAAEPDSVSVVETEDDSLSRSLRELAEELKSDDQ